MFCGIHVHSRLVNMNFAGLCTAAGLPRLLSRHQQAAVVQLLDLGCCALANSVETRASTFRGLCSCQTASQCMTVPVLVFNTCLEGMCTHTELPKLKGCAPSACCCCCSSWCTVRPHLSARCSVSCPSCSRGPSHHVVQCHLATGTTHAMLGGTVGHGMLPV